MFLARLSRSTQRCWLAFLTSAIVAYAYDSKQRLDAQASIAIAGVRDGRSLASIDAVGSVTPASKPPGNAAVIRKVEHESAGVSRHTLTLASEQLSSAPAFGTASSVASMVAVASVEPTPPLEYNETVPDYGPPDTTLKLLSKANSGTLMPIILGISFLFLVLTIIAISFKCLDHKGQSEEEEPLYCQPEPIETDHKDMYGLAVSAVVRDMRSCAMSQKSAAVRVGRLAVTMLTLVTVLSLQVFMLESAGTLVAAQAVGSVRKLYEHYEVVMYGNDKSRMVRTVNGYYRGRAEFFEADNFKLLSDNEKEEICQIPLSQPTFFTTLLSVWSFTVLADIRKCVDLMTRVIYITPTITSLADALQPVELYEEHVGRRTRKINPVTEGQVCVIAGLTFGAKGVLLMFVFLPRLFVNCWLLLLGSRWLTATPNFHELVFNTVALEFILSINVMVFHTMVPKQSIMDMKSTRILPPMVEIHMTPWNGLAAFAWGVVALGYAIAFIYVMQPVLPEYRWDVGDVCMEYLLGKANLTAT